MRTFDRIFLPVLALSALIALIVPPVFRTVTRERAFSEAREDLTVLRQEVASLSDVYFSEGPAAATRTQTTEFLRKAGSLVRTAKGSARLLLYAAEKQLVFPYSEEEKNAAAALTEAVTPLLNDSMPNGTQTVEAEGDKFLLSISITSQTSPRLQYIVVYCPVSDIGAWVEDAVRIVWLLLAALILLWLIASLLIARGLTKPLSRLCRTAESVAAGRLETVEKKFSIKEMETLRRSINDMSTALARSEEAKTLYFQNISHELRTPLMSIGGYAQGIEEGVLPDPRGAAQIILTESRRMSELVDELLTLSRIDRGDRQIESGPVLITEAVKSAIRRVSGVAAEKGVRLVFDAPDETLTARGDERMLSHILNNLLGNAVRHAKSEARVTLTGDGKLTLTVKDDGVGIAKEDMPHLFKRGYKGKNGHFGLGLAIAATAADACGWTIRAENAPEGGAVFTVVF